MTCKHDNKTFFGDASLVGHLVCNDCGYIDVPKYHEGKRVIESNLEICPLCHDTKVVSTPLQTTKMIIDPEYRTECHKCKVWWYTYRTEFRS
tara:strand:+ start:2700 stop:2975 length:276 start_codon:yes stop_codon:yes gene_type:complete